MRLWRRKMPSAPAVVLPSLDRLGGLIERVVELVDEVAGGRAGPEPPQPPVATPASAPEPEPPALPDEAPAGAWLAFVPSPHGYALLERTGPPPEHGQDVDIDGVRYRVVRVARSPLPEDDRRCVYVEMQEEPGADRTPDA